MNEKVFNTQEINEIIKNSKNVGNDTQKVSDGFHTFEELYYHRMILFSVILKDHAIDAFKSKLHDDGTMYENYFICGILTQEGWFTYHYDLKYWDMFDVTEVDYAPKWDGHTSDDVERLLRRRRL